jgi:DNA invertase Pin-like site-specific DNA recombinase
MLHTPTTVVSQSTASNYLGVRRRPKISPDVEKRIQSHLRAGKGILKVARELGLGTSTVQRVAREMGPFGVAAA